MNPNHEAVKWYQQHWENSAPILFDQIPWLQHWRQSQLNCFLESGFPNVDHEDWKYTDLSPLNKLQYQPSQLNHFEFDLAQFHPFYLSGPHHRLVFINGFFSAKLSTSLDLPEGVIFTNFVSALKKHADLIQRLLSQSDYSQSSLQHFNAAFMTDGAFIYIPKNVMIDFPIQLLFVVTSDLPMNSMINLRNLIVAEQGAQAVFLEDYQTVSNQHYFTNVVSQLQANKNSKLDHYKIQNECINSFHIANTQIRQQQSSAVTTQSYSLGARLARDDLHFELNERGAESQLRGLSLLRGDQHVDHHTKVDHKVADTCSEEIYKGVFSDKAQGVFNGKVIIHQNAQRTEAKQQNKNLLLSSKAQVNTKPELEIYANDVKCTHGATVGQIDQDHLFYLRSRGIDEKSSRQLLIMAFINDVINQIQDPLIAEKIQNYVSKISW